MHARILPQRIIQGNAPTLAIDRRSALPPGPTVRRRADTPVHAPTAACRRVDASDGQ